MAFVTDRMRTKVAARTNIDITIFGDSSVAGVGGTTGAGWVYWLAYNWATRIGYNLTMKTAVSGSDSYPSGTTTTVSGAGAPMLTVYHRGVSGTTAEVWSQLMPSNGALYFPVDADLTIIGLGLNDFGLNGRTSANLISYLNIIVARIRALWPSSPPILWETESPADGADTRGTGVYPNTRRPADFYNFFSGTCEGYLGAGKRQPLAPAVQLVSNNFWIIDTWQAFDNTWSTTFTSDQVHPNELGYVTQAQWMFENLPLAYDASRMRSGTSTFQTWTWISGVKTPVFELVPVSPVSFLPSTTKYPSTTDYPTSS